MEVDSDSDSDRDSDSDNKYISELTNETEMDTEMDMDTDTDTDNLNNLIDNFKDISFFGDQDHYLELHNNANIDIDDISSDELEKILDNTNKRYSEYLDKIEFIENRIKNMIIIFKKMFKDYENVSDTTLFKLMNEIDNTILDELHSSTEAKFWF